jgi:uroporphyrinogen III methyltransferase/synthase
MSTVYLVGAGPGDPELITVKGRRILESADAILYDHLAPVSLLEFAPAHAERIYVGKKRAEHAYTQDEIIALLIDRASQGKTVVRLKGGDPFIFGRGGEEVEGLAAAGIDFEVVPGVTSPLGIAAYTGVPLTHREHTSAVTFVTGHSVENIDWNKTGVSETLVIFMGLEHVREIMERVLDAGRSPETPAMAVRWGTRADQVTIVGTLADLADRIEAVQLKPPVTVVVGEVVRLRESLSWFERRPLFGKQLIVTRAKAQAGDFAVKLAALGAAVIELPVIELAPLEDYSVLDGAIARLETYDWVVFTSTNAVDYFVARLRACGRDLRAIRGRICAIGPATREALEELKLVVDLVPEEHIAEGAVTAFRAIDMKGARVLMPRAAEAREVIPKALAEMGAQVDIADTYRNVIPVDAGKRIAEYLGKRQRADWITFTSGSTVKNWVALAGVESLDGVRVASIGPATSEVARRLGVTVDAEADPHTTDGLISALLHACTRSDPR